MPGFRVAPGRIELRRGQAGLSFLSSGGPPIGQTFQDFTRELSLIIESSKK